MSTASTRQNRRFLGVPGVEYPEPEATRRRTVRGLDPKTGRAYESAPEGSISTEEAAVLLGVSPRSALRHLHKSGRPYYRVHRH